MPGRIPDREENLARPRERKGSDQMSVTKGTLRPVTVPPPDPEWGHAALMLYSSLLSSGMADFYQDSDWAYAWVVISELDAYRKPAPMREKGSDGKYRDVVIDGEVQYYPTHKISGQMFQSLMSAMGVLGLTEGDRRRMRIELSEPDEGNEEAKILSLVHNNMENVFDD